MNKTIEELTMLLLYLTAWEEESYYYDDSDNLDKIILKRSWKGYPFAILDTLQEEGILFDSENKSKSVTFTKEGEKKASELLHRYLESSST